MIHFPNYINTYKLKKFIKEALKEDIGNGDHSTLATISNKLTKTAQLIIKENCIIAGIDLAEFILHFFDKNIIIKKNKFDGDSCKKKDIAFTIIGNARSILTVERLILNCMQRMSAIATITHKIVQQTKGTKCKILDTRKTTPNFRMFEKWAVQIGGGFNHRFGLYDMIIIKDNHIDYNKNIKKTINKTVQYLQQKKLNLKIEIETRNLQEVIEAVKTKKINRIMLDNMDLKTMKKAIKIIGNQCETEASGRINQNNLKSIIETGVDFISIGALTHSVKNIDLSLKAIIK